MQKGPGQGTCGRWIFYVSVPVQLRVLIPYMVGDVTGCSEGCAFYINFDVFVVRDGVGVHYQDSCVPLGSCGCLEEQRSPGQQREAEGLSLLGCPAPEARG
jgi:hypothetical protein